MSYYIWSLMSYNPYICISEHWKTRITGYSIWSLARSQKRLAVYHLALTLSTGSWSRRKYWTRLIQFQFLYFKTFSRDQRINLAWFYGTPPPTCWWRGSLCSTPSSRWSPSLEAHSVYSLGSPLWHFGMEQKRSSECGQGSQITISNVSFPGS